MLPLPIASERREKAGLSKGKAGGATPGSSAQQKSGHEAQSIGAAVEWEIDPGGLTPPTLGC
jgi:hypothetical protein